MTFQEHCQESIRVFGKAYEDVHRYLDHYMGQPGIGMKHRRFRHHQAGIQEIIKLYGEEAGEAARQHIISDLKQEGWDPDRDPFPRDQEHFIQIGFYG